MIKRSNLFGISMTILFLSGCMNAHFSYPDPEISIENLEATVRHLTEITPSRSSDHPESMRNSAAFIFGKFAQYGLIPEDQEFEVQGERYVNVIASVGNPEADRLILGAHYDVCGDQPGADDNASGIAGLLGIARFAKKHESELPYRVDFVAYALEEPPYFRTPHMGSYVHAESLHKSKVKVRGMICLEMIGFFTDKKKSQSYPLAILRLFYPSKGNFIGIVGNYGSASLVRKIAKHMKASSIDVRTLKAPAFVTGVDFSDHQSYWKFGYDAVMITDTAFYRNPNYHLTTDTIDTLDFARMNEVVKGVCWGILNLRRTAEMQRHRKYIVALTIFFTAVIVAVFICFTPSRNLRARWDCYLDVSHHLAEALNEHYKIHKKYFSTVNDGPWYCPASDLLKEGLVVSREFSKTEEQAGRRVKFKGGLVDPFRIAKIFPTEHPLTGFYYHSASAEWWVRIRGYSLRYFCSRNRNWALILSNAPDEDIDVDQEFLSRMDSLSRTMDEVISALRPFAFEFSQEAGDPGFQENKALSDSGDFILLLWEGEMQRISP